MGKSAVPIISVCLKWAVTHVIGLHVELTILREYDVASTTVADILISNKVFTVDTSLVGLSLKRIIVLVSRVKRNWPMLTA